MALSDYRANSNPTPGSQQSNKPLLLAFDSSSTPVFDSLEITGDVIFDALTGVLIGHGTSPLTAESPLSKTNGGTGQTNPSLAAGTHISINGSWPNQTVAFDGLINLASEVTGILPVPNGGSGTATPSLVAGTNITITGTWPNQTVNTTGALPTPALVTGVTTPGNGEVHYTGDPSGGIDTITVFLQAPDSIVGLGGSVVVGGGKGDASNFGGDVSIFGGTGGAGHTGGSVYISPGDDGTGANIGKVFLGFNNNIIISSNATNDVFNAGGALYPATPAAAQQSASSLYAGTGAPSNADGANGDYYFRSDGGASTHIYFKSGGAWVGII